MLMFAQAYQIWGVASQYQWKSKRRFWAFFHPFIYLVLSLFCVRSFYFRTTGCVEILITEMIQLYRNTVERSYKPIYMWGKKAVILAP